MTDIEALLALVLFGLCIVAAIGAAVLWMTCRYELQERRTRRNTVDFYRPRAYRNR